MKQAFLCLDCREEFSYGRTFNQHLKKFHNCTSEEQVLRIVHNGIHPICECGCEKFVTFCWKESRFYDRLRGHASQVLKKKRGEALKEFNKTNLGKEILTNRSKKMIDFYESPEGLQNKKASKERNFSRDYAATSSSLKRFNETKEGKETNKQRSKKVRNWYSSKEGQLYLSKKKLDSSKAWERCIEARKKFQILDFENSYIGLKKTVLDVVCNQCNFRAKRSLQSIIHIPRCFACQKYPEISGPQREIYEFVQSFGFEVFSNDWKTLGDREIDIWVPSKQLAIEYNGLYWHCEKNRWKEHNETKVKKLSAKGIKRLIIFEDEWRDKKELVKSMIRYRLGMVSRKFHARKCEIRELNANERRTFFEKNHIDGDVNSIVSWGLVSNNEILSAISIRRPFHKSLRESSYELARFANAQDVTVSGGLARLTAVAIDWIKNKGEVKSLITYVDTRIGDGKGYELAGFSFERKTEISFWWSDMRNRYNRFKFRAGNGKTEKEVAEENSVVRIYGCSNLVYRINTKASD